MRRRLGRWRFRLRERTAAVRAACPSDTCEQRGVLFYWCLSVAMLPHARGGGVWLAAVFFAGISTTAQAGR